MNWRRATRSTIALDAGPVTTAVCQLVGARAGPRLDRWSVLEDPLRERAAPETAGPRLVERAARLLRQVECRGRDASLVLKPPDVTFVTAAIPETEQVSPAQARTMLRFEAARQMQCDPEALEVDSWRLPPANRSGCNVMIAAVRHDTLTRWGEFADALGLTLRRIDVLPCALLRSAWRLGPPGRADGRAPEELLWGVLDIGFSSALLALAIGSHCVYVRTLTSGGDAVTLALVDALDVDYRAAEVLKRQYRSPRTKPAGAAAPPPAWSGGGDFSEVMWSVVREPLRVLSGEIERAFAYAMESYPDATPCGLYLCGGGARLDGLPETLAELLEIETPRLDPCRGFAPPRGAPAQTELASANLAACVGLALGDLE